MAQSNLHFFSDGPSKPLLGSDVLFPTSPYQSYRDSEVDAHHLNFLYVCAAAQMLQIDFLPISWQPQLGSIGWGGTAEIHQSLLSLETSLAFKAIDLAGTFRARTTRDEERIYAAVMSEILLLNKKAVRESPFIHAVDGICWNVDARGPSVLPVLVYEKTPQGDLHRFFTSGRGREMTLLDRIKLCRNVAEALKTLHACNVIHGDIKPQNVLVFELSDGSFITKLSDFGYSTAYRTDDAMILVPCSQPWNAPEVEHGGSRFNPSEAIKTDMFSFGLLCLWALLKEALSNQFAIALDLSDKSSPQASAGNPPFEAITEMKNQDKLRTFCQSHIESMSDLDSPQKEELIRLFNLTLTPDPAHRETHLQVVSDSLHNIQENMRSAPAIDGIGAFVGTTTNANEEASSDPQLHYKFEISRSILQFMNVDRRVREHITLCLLDQAQEHPCHECRTNAAFQLALCFKIGFGLPASETCAQEWLQNSGKTSNELQNELRLMSQMSQAHLYHTIYLNNLHNHGYLSPIDYFDVYRADSSFDQARQAYMQEISDLEAGLGNQSPSVYVLKAVFVSLLKGGGAYEEASKLQEKQLRLLETHPGFGPDHLDTLIALSDFSELCRLQGKLEEASRYCDQVLGKRTQLFGPDHPITLTSLHMKAQLLEEMGSLGEAEGLYRAVLSKRESVFGKLHGATLKSINDLGGVLMQQMQYEPAQAYYEEALHFCEQVFGQLHYSTLISINNLASLFCEKQDFMAAKELCDRVVPGFRTKLGGGHPLTFISLANLGSIYLKLERYDESLSCYNESLNGLEDALGTDHARTLDVVLAKAILLELRGEYEQANDMFERCIQGRERTLGLEHPEVLIALQEYSLFLFEQENLHEAEKCYRSLLQRQEHRLGSNHPVLLETLSHLGDVLQDLGQEGAEDMYRRALTLSTAVLGPEQETTLGCMRSLASVLQEKGCHDQAEPLYRCIIESKRAQFGEDKLPFLQDIDSLSAALVEQGNLAEAEDVQRESLEYSKNYLQTDNPDILARLSSLARILNERGNFAEAESTYRECITSSKAISGECSEMTLKLSADIASVMQQQGKPEKARQCGLQALETSRRTYGPRHPTSLRVGDKVAAILFRQGDKEGAIATSLSVLEGSRSTYGPDHEETQIAKHNYSIFSRRD